MFDYERSLITECGSHERCVDIFTLYSPAILEHALYLCHTPRAECARVVKHASEYSSSSDDTLLYSVSCSVYYLAPHRSFSRHDMSSCYIAQCTDFPVLCRSGKSNIVVICELNKRET